MAAVACAVVTLDAARQRGSATPPPKNDPNRQEWIQLFNGRDLNGWYTFYDEGVEGRKVTLINNGVLKDYLKSRTPTLSDEPTTSCPETRLRDWSPSYGRC